MFECESFSGPPGGSLAAQLQTADAYRLDEARKARRRLYVGFSPQAQAQTTSIVGGLDPTGAQRLDQQIAAVAWLLRASTSTTLGSRCAKADPSCPPRERTRDQVSGRDPDPPARATWAACAPATTG